MAKTSALDEVSDFGSTYTISDDPDLNVHEELRRELQSFGLSPNEARILMHLSCQGPLKARDVAEALDIHRTETYHLLTSLQNKGVVYATFQHPIKFGAVSFEKALSLFIELERGRLIMVERRKQKLCRLWESLPKGLQKNEESEVFQVIEGVNQVYFKMGEMVRTAEKTIGIVIHDSRDLPHLYHYEIFDRLHEAARRKISTQIISNESARSSGLIRNVKGAESHFLRGIAELDTLPHFLLVDDKELLLLVKTSGVSKKHFAALWTNYNSFIQSMRILFSKLWESESLENIARLKCIT